MKILVINAGSSSLKYQLMRSEDGHVYAKGLCERIGIDGSRIIYKNDRDDNTTHDTPMPTHSEALHAVLAALQDEKIGVVKDLNEIEAVGHRVVHGGEKFNKSVLINKEVLTAIEDCIPLAPLHNPANLLGIKACIEIMPSVPQVAVFDTAFHQTMPKAAYMYAVPYKYYEQYGVRRYGFHGTSHQFVSEQAAEYLKKPLKELKIVTCHLGNGSSLAAVKNGVCVDTSMGMTPLAGVPMGTRSGDIDPAIIKYLMDSDNSLTIKNVDRILNKESGMLGVSGVGSDFRDLAQAESEGNERATLALNMFSYDVRKYIGSYAFAMGGLDCIVFTAGVGEHDAEVRERVCLGLEKFGIQIDSNKNANVHGFAEISLPTSKVKILVVPTNEELKIAQDTAKLAAKK
ncbi:acetate/propionate family kinase [Amygdalobacter nucleatus]|uniref:Acetate kinase n=1 Tax=Amygdalobacter nucleatus TaxID=3029274 RepID=A0A133YC39_9FIRM|nr:acetate kinase [Amygdalobacter nucleatus]KXB40786.1 acetate kinase [Amygdalobacter nucleatus]MDF0485159.1 acetate kinase [Amygdalobacter nucleatus]WEG36958.1 acetate kinase [Amygdalobacter nucleatus]